MGLGLGVEQRQEARLVEGARGSSGWILLAGGEIGRSGVGGGWWGATAETRLQVCDTS